MFRPLFVIAVIAAAASLTASAGTAPRYRQTGCSVEHNLLIVEMTELSRLDKPNTGYPSLQLEASGMVVRMRWAYAPDWDTVPTLHGARSTDGWGILRLHFPNGGIDTIGWVIATAGQS